LDTSLGGTTSAARPELAGTVLEDDVQTFSFLGITGTVQNRVVREDVSGTLDFYWRIKVDEGVPGVAAPGAISAFRLGILATNPLMMATGASTDLVRRRHTSDAFSTQPSTRMATSTFCLRTGW
jgi:hypothetical protein